MKNIQRRAYQNRAARKAMGTDGALLIVSPGGSGKTVIAALIVKMGRKLKKRVLVISHRREIIHQTVKTLLRATKECVSIILGDETSAQQEAIIVASITTLARRGLFPEADIVIIDEAHRSAAPSYAKLIDYYKKRGARVIGLTATPRRLDGLGLYQHFDELYEAAKPSQLLGKYIMKPITYSAPPEYLPDLVGVRSKDGEFNANDVMGRVNKAGLVGGIVDHVKKHWRKGSLGILFACSVDHSQKCMSALQKAGFKARHIDGKLSTKDRDKLIEEIEAGEIDILCCCMLLTEGWDLPECDLVIFARPTRSETLFIQMANRGSRKGRHRPVILDHACNTVMHGYSWIDREWSLDGIVRGNPGNPKDYKFCEVCHCINDVDEEFCENCGNDLTRTRKVSPVEQTQLTLVEWSKIAKIQRMKKVRDFAKKRGLGKKWVERVEELWVT